MLDIFDRIDPRSSARDIDEDLENFKRMLQIGKRKRVSTFMTVTPSIAAYALRNNPDNRRQKRQRIAEIKSEIEKGTYECNGESIIFSSCGLTNDGQNRLQAVLESGISIESNVAFGVPRETRKTVDSIQTSRSAADYLTMDGIGNADAITRIGSVLRAIELRGSFAPAKGLQARETYEYSTDNVDEIREAMEVVTKKEASLLLNHQTLCALYILFARRAGSEVAGQFMQKLLTGAGLSASSPILVLRSRLNTEKQKVKQFSRLQFNQMMEMTIRTWNHYRAGTTCGHLKVINQWPEISD
jgi:anti-sigma28 factor (negative regulator of flagellin synthesis)